MRRSLFLESLKNTFDRFLAWNGLLLVRYGRPGRLAMVAQLRSQRDLLLNNCDAVQLMSAVTAVRHVPGALAEVGVAYGASAHLISQLSGGKTLHLFDTFSGLPRPSSHDKELFAEHSYACPLEEVARYLDDARVVFHKGLFPAETGSEVEGERFALVHLDVDLYESMLNSLRFFYPRMSPGGIIIAHDFRGTPAVDRSFREFFEDKPEPVIELTGDQCLVVKLSSQTVNGEPELAHTREQQEARPVASRRRRSSARSSALERGVAILSFDTEQIWGHLDRLNEAGFRELYPNALEAHDSLLNRLNGAGVSATWFVVGGMALIESQGDRDCRLTGLPDHWTAHVPAGSEATTPLWYRRSFIERLRDSVPQQEIGLHGGLTHLIWTNERVTKHVARQELTEGVNALQQLRVVPKSFSFPRDQEAYHELLPAHGILCYRGRLSSLSHRLGRTFGGRVLRVCDELRRAAPPLIWPEETLPGLWNVPSSMFLYPIGPSRTRLVALRTRVERFSCGLDAAIRESGVFHFCLHPENLAESPLGLVMLDDILERLVRARDSGDIEILTVAGMGERMESLRQQDGVARAAVGPQFEQARVSPASSD